MRTGGDERAESAVCMAQQVQVWRVDVQRRPTCTADMSTSCFRLGFTSPWASRRAAEAVVVVVVVGEGEDG